MAAASLRFFMNANWIERQQRWKEFTSTPIGMAFAKFENLHAMAWQKDTALQFNQGFGGEKSTNEAWKKSDEARKDLLKLLGYEDL